MKANGAKDMSGDSHKFIRADNQEEVREWCVRLECTETDLYTAVKAVGGRPSWVAEYLMARRPRRSSPATP
jgi:hypothetical protein